MFYVYILIDPRDDFPFYVGKGKGPRINEHVLNVDRHYNFLLKVRILEIAATGNVITEKWVESADEDYCHWLEIYLIDFYGRLTVNEGPLLNLTDGGEGVLGWSEASRRKLGDQMFGNKRGCKKRSEETRKKMGAWQRGKKKSYKTVQIYHFPKGYTPWNKGLKKGTLESPVPTRVPS